MPRPNRGASLKWIGKRRAFYIVWFESGRERSRSTGTADGREAEGILADFIRERQRLDRRAGPAGPEAITVAEVLDLYGTQHAPTAASPERIGYALAALLPFWAERPVAEITKQTCREYGASRVRIVRGKPIGEGAREPDRTAPCAPGTVRRELGALTAALNFAVGERVLTVAPLVELPEKPEGKDRWLTRGEAARLLNAARTARGDVRLYLPLFILIGLYTGARKEAIASLTWDQLDLPRGRINFAKPGERRTAKQRAHISIPRRLMTFLRLAHRRRAPRREDVRDETLSEAQRLARGYVVHDSGAQVIDIGDSNGGSFGSACRRAGLSGVSPHTLRHTCGTWLAQAGVPLWEIGGWLGHSSEATSRLYAHHSPDFQAAAKAALDRRRE